MKKTFILILILLFSISIYAEVIALKNGDKIKGKIVSADENSITVETSFGKMVIDKEKIETIIYDDSKISGSEESKKEKTEEEENNEEDYEKNLEKRFKNDLLFQRYKSLLNAGIGFIIPGAICTITPLIFFTPAIVSAFQHEGMTLFNYPIFVFGFTWYVGVMGIGLILDIGAIIFFVFSGRTFNDWINKKNESKVSIYSGYDGSDINIGFTLKL